MIEVAQDLDGLLHNAVRLAALDVDHEADAAGLVLELRIVEPLLRRRRNSPIVIGHGFPLTPPHPQLRNIARSPLAPVPAAPKRQCKDFPKLAEGKPGPETRETGASRWPVRPHTWNLKAPDNLCARYY